MLVVVAAKIAAPAPVLAVPEVVEAVRALPARNLILDGEALSLKSDGRPQPFQVTMRRFGRKLDVEKTKQQREDHRRARLASGKSFDEFMVEWNQKSPPQDILQWYGTWPDAQSTGPVFRP